MREVATNTSRYLRLPEVLEVFPVSKSTWFQGVKDGRYPSPLKLSKRCSAWALEDIHALIKDLEMKV